MVQRFVAQAWCIGRQRASGTQQRRAGGMFVESVMRDSTHLYQFLADLRELFLHTSLKRAPDAYSYQIDQVWEIAGGARTILWHRRTGGQICQVSPSIGWALPFDLGNNFALHRRGSSLDLQVADIVGSDELLIPLLYVPAPVMFLVLKGAWTRLMALARWSFVWPRPPRLVKTRPLLLEWPTVDDIRVFNISVFVSFDELLIICVFNYTRL